MCLYPRLIRNKKYTPNKKNGGIIPAVSDTRVLITPIGCGKCIECKKKKSREWQVRLLEEVRHNKDGKFVTLTFSNESYKKLAREHKGLKGYELDNAIATTAVRRFLERWRKKYKKSVRHWLVTELGHNGTENIHLHGILWTNEKRETVAELWHYGYIWPRYDKDWKNNYVSEKTVNYITKYITKTDLHHKLYNSKILTSSGIGRQYIDRSDAKRKQYIPNKTEEYYTTRTGHKMAMPIYWRNKIWTDEEKEKLWIEKLDKQERWVDGQKIDISKGMDKYYKALKIAREKNKRLGYGSLEDWKYEDYEKKQRWLKQQERITGKKEPVKNYNNNNDIMREIGEKLWENNNN